MADSAATRTPARAATRRLPLVLAAGAALIACVAAALVGGAATPAVGGLEDPGPVVRWGLPLLRSGHDLAAALTVGLLIFAASLIPDEAAGTSRRAMRAGRLAVGAGAIWVVTGVAGVVLGFADAAGTALTSPDLPAQLQAFVWSLETSRMTIISAGLAALATTVAAAAVTRRGMAFAAVAAVAAVLPLALAGHASGRADHETAVDSIAFHLLGALLWVGGLLALAVTRGSLGGSLPVVVQRYSTMALWCYVAVGASGALNAWIRLGTVGELFTAYGSLILAKVAAFVALGVAGFLQRRRVLIHLRAAPGSQRLFARLALTEVTIMGLAFGVATALARSAGPDIAPAPSTATQSLTGFPEPGPPGAWTWATTWRWDWLWGTVGVLGIFVYLRAVRRMRRRGDRWPVSRTVNWVLGWLVFIWATCGAPGVYGRVTFSWHMIEHMVIAMAVPILLVLGAPVTLALRVLPARGDGTIGLREIVLGIVHSRPLRALGNPVVAALIFFVSLVVFYYSPAFELALLTHPGHVLMITHFLLTGYLLAWVLVGVDPGPPKWAPALRLVVLFATISFHAFFGVVLSSGTTLLAPDFFGRLHLPWLPDPLADQQLGGSLAWGVGEFPTLVLAMLVTLAWVRSDAAETRRGDRQAERDGDADLAAYNARLQQLSDRAARAERSTSSRRPPGR